MINKLKNYLILFCLFSLTAALLSYVIITKYAQPRMVVQETKAPQGNPAPFIAQVDSLMTSTWNQFEEQAGVTLADCNQYLEKQSDNIKAEILRGNNEQREQFEPLSSQTITFVHEIMNDFDIKPSDIDLVAMKSGSPAGANAYSLYIDEKYLNTFSTDAQRFIIAHEISHIKNKDNLTETALVNLLNTDNKVHSDCIDTFTRSIEFRADTQAMLAKAKYTQGGIAFFKEYIKRYGDSYSSTHPRPSDRLKIAQDVDAMHAQGVQHA